MLVSVSCPNRRRRASTLVAYTIFSRSGNPTKYIRAPAVRDRNKCDAFSSSFHCPKVFFKLVYPSFEVALPVIFFRPKTELFQLDPSHLLAVPALGLRSPSGGWRGRGRCSKIKPEGGVVHGGLRLNSLLLPLFFEEYLGVGLHACGLPRSAQRTSNTAATRVTTVFLSVCYGALNLLVRVDASNFVPYVCDQAVTGGECEDPEVPYRRPLFLVLAWQQKGRTVHQGLSHLYFPSLCGSKGWGHMLALCPFFL